MVLFMTGVISCMHNGFYLVFSSLAKSPGDATSLIACGTPMVLIIGVGLLMFGIGVVLAGMCLRLIGIGPSEGVKSRMLVLVGGLLPYLIATLLYQWLYNAAELAMWVTKGAIIVVVLLVFSIVSGIMERRVYGLGAGKAKKVTWSAVLLANVCAVLLLSVIFILLGYWKPEMPARYIMS
jgi:hypothetical protein